MPRPESRPAPDGRPTATVRPGPCRRQGSLVVLVPALIAALTGCAVEAVTGDIADQQLCVAAQPVVEAVGRRGEPGEPPSSVPDTRELARRAVDPGLAAALAALGEAYGEASGDAPESQAWADADRAVASLDRVCQRLSAF